MAPTAVCSCPSCARTRTLLIQNVAEQTNCMTGRAGLRSPECPAPTTTGHACFGERFPPCVDAPSAGAAGRCRKSSRSLRRFVACLFARNAAIPLTGKVSPAISTPTASAAACSNVTRKCSRAGRCESARTRTLPIRHATERKRSITDRVLEADRSWARAKRTPTARCARWHASASEPTTGAKRHARMCNRREPSGETPLLDHADQPAAAARCAC